MTNKADMLGISIDLYDTKQATRMVCSYLNKESSNTVFFVDEKICRDIQDSDEARGLVNSSDMVLLSKKVGADVDSMHIKTQLPIDVSTFFDKLFSQLEKDMQELYIVTDTDEEVDILMDAMHTNKSNLLIQGSGMEDIGEYQYDMLTNNINSVAPDVLLLCGGIDRQMDFLINYRTQINTSVCIFVGEEFKDISYLDSNEKGIMKKFKKTVIYKRFKK